MNESNQPEAGIDRRGFLRGGTLGAAAAIAGPLLTHVPEWSTSSDHGREPLQPAPFVVMSQRD